MSSQSSPGLKRMGEVRPTANGLQFRRSLVMTSVQILTSQPVAFAAALCKVSGHPARTN
jgi:hypothetical protein